ncbi:unnamed protein product [Ostreobium quekettii]|uniref:RRM domain-containing protein n=1 Tax=Ostreobium quekettii TaxID=121088 RepID=A0A8S1IWG8_9CHLO|nr:unnamed protein product [Ostreobium quekettii]
MRGRADHLVAPKGGRVRKREDDENGVEPCKVFVGGITQTVDERRLKDLFRRYHPLDATVMRERMTSRPRGFGFVTLPDKRAMEDAIRGLHNSKVDGRTISVRHAIPQDQQHPHPFRDRARDFGEGGERAGGYVVRREPLRREPYTVGRDARYVDARNGVRPAAASAVPRREGGYYRRDPRVEDRVPRREYNDYVYEVRPTGETVRAEKDAYGGRDAYERSYAADEYTYDRGYDTYSRDARYEQEPQYTQSHHKSGSYSAQRQEYLDSEYPADAYEYYDANVEYAEYETRYEDTGRAYTTEGRSTVVGRPAAVGRSGAVGASTVVGRQTVVGRTAEDGRSYAADYDRAPRLMPARDVRSERQPVRTNRVPGRLPPPRAGGPDRRRDVVRPPLRPAPYEKSDRLEKRPPLRPAPFEKADRFEKTDRFEKRRKVERLDPPSKDRAERVVAPKDRHDDQD